MWTDGCPSRSTLGWLTRPSSPWPRRRSSGQRSPGRTCWSRSLRPAPVCPQSKRRSPIGISVNVTLIFSLERYREVMEAYIAGLETRHAAGNDVAEVESVASFFVSRVDTAVDPLLEAIGTDQALALRGRAAGGERETRLQGVPSGCSAAPGGRPRRGWGPAATPTLGLDRCQEPRLLRHHVGHRPGGTRDRQHHARADPAGRRRPRDHHPRHDPGWGTRIRPR